jgi:hypothetical protein
LRHKTTRRPQSWIDKASLPLVEFILLTAYVTITNGV